MLVWDICNDQVNEEILKKVEDKISFKFPESYIKLVKECDEGYPIQSNFNYYDEYAEEMFESAIGAFISINDENFLEMYNSPPEFFPENIIAFAETGGGDLICFDYRQGKNNLDPPIVYWNHGADIGKDVSFIANNFEEFIAMLKEPEDI